MNLLTTQRHAYPGQWITLKVWWATTAIEIWNAKAREWIADKAGRAFAAAGSIEHTLTAGG